MDALSSGWQGILTGGAQIRFSPQPAVPKFTGEGEHTDLQKYIES